MILHRRNTYDDKQYVCELTQFLDEVCCFRTFGHFQNYLYDLRDTHCNCFGIRHPGRTTGVVEIDENSIIVRCEIGSDVIPNEYPEDVNTQLKTFIGTQIEIKQYGGNYGE